ncbi:MAG TPA: nucleotide pyrophosphatase/phosphodiesterase family protein [Micromonosporaceae bacterium]|nr:nucleotide pyrophosphatase/phosphodiesterase family protein [Micromonosporaceae bacterium]
MEHRASSAAGTGLREVPADALVRPAYGTASLADVLPAALAALGLPGAPDPLGLTEQLAGVRRVAVLLVDGLGFHQLPLAAPYAPALADALAGRLGQLRPLTAPFPSTTPTSLATLGTGAAPGAHGILGFTLNVPGTDRVLTHINWWEDPDPLRWQPLETRFTAAAAAGFDVTVVSSPEFVDSGLTKAANRGGAYRGARGGDELAGEMLRALAGAAAPALVYGYFPDLDRVGHLCGVDSEPWRDQAAEVDRLVTRVVAGLPADAALLVTADHGQLDVPGDHRFDLDADPRLRAGVRVVAGEPRVRYLHTRPGAADDVVAAWRGVLGDAAWVAHRAEAVADGWFGPVPERHLERVGDVVVACHDRYAVLATRTEPVMVAQLVAYHGSYTATEMVIPLLVVRSVGRSVAPAG